MMPVGVPVGTGLSHWGRGFPAFLFAKKAGKPRPQWLKREMV